MADEADFFMCLGDGLPALVETIENGDGSPPDLTQSGTGFQLVIQDENHAADAFGGPATFIGSGPTDPELQYVWQQADIDKIAQLGVGIYLYRWVVTFPGIALPETFPNGKRARRLLVSPRT